MFLLSGISSRAIILQPNAEPTLHLEKAKNLLIIMVHSAVFYFNNSYNYLGVTVGEVITLRTFNQFSCMFNIEIISYVQTQTASNISFGLISIFVTPLHLHNIDSGRRLNDQK